MRRYALAGVSAAAAATVAALAVGGVGASASGTPATAAAGGVAPGASAKAGAGLVPAGTHAAGAAMAADPPSESIAGMYLKIPGIPGEATAEGHVNEIEIFSESWGISNPLNGSGKPNFSSISLQLKSDRSAPPLETAVALGKNLGIAVLFEVSNNGQPIRTLELDNAHADSISFGAAKSAGAESASLSLSFSRIKTTYYWVSPKGGTRPYTSCYDIAARQVC